MDIKTKVCNSKKLAKYKIKTTFTFNKPTYVGMCILELSKLQIPFPIPL